MNLEEMTAKELTNQIVEDEKQLEEMKKQLLAKKIMAKAMIKQAEKNKTELPSQLFNKMKAKMTGFFARVHEDAQFALQDPDAYAASELLDEADKLRDKALKVSGEEKRAKKYAIKCASMVMRLESARDQLKLDEAAISQLDFVAQALDKEVQRLRPKKEEKPETIQQLQDTMEEIERQIQPEGAPAC